MVLFWMLLGMLFGRMKNAAVSRCVYADCVYSVKLFEILEKMEKAGLIAGFMRKSRRHVRVYLSFDDLGHSPLRFLHRTSSVGRRLYVRAKSLRRMIFRNRYNNIIMTAKGPLAF
jgi:ribosomal protein S8